MIRFASKCGQWSLVQQWHQTAVITGVVALMVGNDNLELAIDSQLAVVTLL